jgi:hypothetical protein
LQQKDAHPALRATFSWREKVRQKACMSFCKEQKPMLLTAIESFLMIAVLTAAFIWYALAHGRREDRDGRSSGDLMAEGPARDPDAHLGRRGTE